MNLPKSNPARSILTISIGFVVIFSIINKDSLGFTITEIRVTGDFSYTWILLASAILGIIGIVSHTLSKKVEWVWFKIIGVLGLVVPKILLTIIFYLVLVPIALLSKGFSNKKPLSLKNDKGSLFQDRQESFKKASFEDPW